MRKTGNARLSVNKNPSLSPKGIRRMHTGRVRSRDRNSPADTERGSSRGRFSALLFEIIRDTVMGIPPVPMVRKREKRERATWYNPNPSAPMSRESAMRYKNPKPRSATDRPVTRDAVRAMVFFEVDFFILYCTSLPSKIERGKYAILNVKIPTYNIIC